MFVRTFTDDDYEDVGKWWIAQGWPVLPLELLPDMGIIVEVNGNKACVGWLYTSNSKLAWLGWPVANPDVSSFSRGKAVLKMIETLEGAAKGLGYSAIMTFSEIPAMLKAYEHENWHIGESTKQILKRL